MWGLKWSEAEASKALSFVSVAADGRIALWVLSKDQLAVQDVLALAVPGSQPDADKPALLASGLCFDFHKVWLRVLAGQHHVQAPCSRPCWLG